MDRSQTLRLRFSDLSAYPLDVEWLISAFNFVLHFWPVENWIRLLIIKGRVADFRNVIWAGVSSFSNVRYNHYNVVNKIFIVL